MADKAHALSHLFSQVVGLILKLRIKSENLEFGVIDQSSD